jgi:fructose-1,6-bisphosphatase/inositol monophosphatase family enzyme
MSNLAALLSPDKMVKRIHGILLRTIRRKLRTRQLTESAFEPIYIPRTAKHLVEVDLAAERDFQADISAEFGDEFAVVGEESLTRDLDLRAEKRKCLLVDMIDGTDLLQHNFSNWCFAAVAFDPCEPKILGSYVALPNAMPLEVNRPTDYLYFATDSSGVGKKPLRVKNNATLRFPPLNKNQKLRHASICMNTQKAQNLQAFLELAKNGKFAEWVAKTAARKEPAFRFYNFAGNPMMVRLADSNVKNGCVDAVIDIVGQAPHDVVPGALVALRSGAVMKDLDGRNITEEILAELLLQPGKNKLKYVLAVGPKLADEIIDLLN